MATTSHTGTNPIEQKTVLTEAESHTVTLYPNTKLEEDGVSLTGSVRYGSYGKIKTLASIEDTGAGRFVDQRINPEFLIGRKNEYPRG